MKCAVCSVVMQEYAYYLNYLFPFLVRIIWEIFICIFLKTGIRTDFYDSLVAMVVQK